MPRTNRVYQRHYCGSTAKRAHLPVMTTMFATVYPTHSNHMTAALARGPLRCLPRGWAGTRRWRQLRRPPARARGFRTPRPPRAPSPRPPTLRGTPACLRRSCPRTFALGRARAVCHTALPTMPAAGSPSAVNTSASVACGMPKRNSTASEASARYVAAVGLRFSRGLISGPSHAMARTLTAGTASRSASPEANTAAAMAAV